MVARRERGAYPSKRPCLAGALRLANKRTPSLDTIFEDSWWASVVAPRQAPSAEDQEQEGDDTLVAMLQHTSVADSADRALQRSNPSETDELARRSTERDAQPRHWIEENACSPLWVNVSGVRTGGFNSARFGLSASTLRRRSLAAQQLPAPMLSPMQERGGLSSALAIQDRAIRKANKSKSRRLPVRTSMRGLPEVPDESLAQLLNESLRVCHWTVSAQL